MPANDKKLIFTKTFSNGITKTYYKKVSPEMDVNAHNMDRLIANYVQKTKTAQEKEDEDLKPIPLNDEKTEEEQHEAFRQVVKNCRARAEKAANSYLFRYHTVFTTTDKNLSRNPSKLIKKVSKYLDRLGVKYFLILELNHPQPVWKYETECDKEEFLKNYDFTKNAYNCANRYALAPLENENGYHIHALTDKKVDFTKWIKKYNGDPNNLYSEAFNYYESDSVYVEDMKLHNPSINKDVEIQKLQQKRNLNYMLKYVYYTKATVAPNLHIYRTNADVHDVVQNNISLSDENVSIEVYDKHNYENVKKLIATIRKKNNNLSSSWVKRIADTFYNALLNSTDNNDYNNVVDAFMECNYVGYMNVFTLINEYDCSCNHNKHNRNYGDEEYDDDDVICYYYPINAVYTYLIQEHLCFYADLIWDIVTSVYNSPFFIRNFINYGSVYYTRSYYGNVSYMSYQDIMDRCISDTLVLYSHMCSWSYMCSWDSDNVQKRTFKSSMKNKILQSETNRSNTECHVRLIPLITPHILKKFTLIQRIARKGMIFFFTRLKIPKGF